MVRKLRKLIRVHLPREGNNRSRRELNVLLPFRPVIRVYGVVVPIKFRLHDIVHLLLGGGIPSLV